jgi:hypothetical protein
MMMRRWRLGSWEAAELNKRLDPPRLQSTF